MIAALLVEATVLATSGIAGFMGDARAVCQSRKKPLEELREILFKADCDCVCKTSNFCASSIVQCN